MHRDSALQFFWTLDYIVTELMTNSTVLYRSILYPKKPVQYWWLIMTTRCFHKHLQLIKLNI